MLINLRNALMAGKRLPYDAEVEYLQSSGTQYIPFEVPFYGIDITTSHVENNNSYGIAGAWNGGSRANSVKYTTAQSRGWTITNYLNSGNVFSGSLTQNAPTRITVHGTSVTVNDTSYTMGEAWYPGNNVYKFALFGCYNRGETVDPLSGRIYHCSLYDVNDDLAYDFIPVRKGSTGYLYDRVSGRLFGNAGTGDFVVGQDVVPVEYIESGSNYAQVIDTGFYANQNTKALITFEKLGVDGWLFGSRNGSSSATDKFGIFAYLSPDGKISAQVGNVYIEPIISGGLTNRKRTIELSLSDGVIVDGETIATFSESQKSQTFASTYPMTLFNMRVSSSGFNSGIYCRVYAYQIFGNGLIARNFLPVRVGTDATSWEGAMMDVLTRRIYRNAGTGAFTYGNDLKYPIPSE